MKRIIFILILGVMTSVVYGQIEVEDSITELYGDGYTYIHEWSESNLVTLYNKDKVYKGIPIVFKDTGETPPDFLSDDPILEDGWSHTVCLQIINDAFTVEQKQALKNKILHIMIYVDSTTGRLTDVVFTFHERTLFNNLPLSLWRNLELKLKEFVYLTPSEYGKRMNYLSFSWNHKLE